MITLLTHFIAKDAAAASELEGIFQKLIQETPSEQGFNTYEVFSVSNMPNSYYIFEKWESQADLNRHVACVAGKGYTAQAVALLKNRLENIILQSFH